MSNADLLEITDSQEQYNAARKHLGHLAANEAATQTQRRQHEVKDARASARRRLGLGKEFMTQAEKDEQLEIELINDLIENEQKINHH